MVSETINHAFYNPDTQDKLSRCFDRTCSLSLVTVEHPRAVLEKGGLRALTAFFEFFPNHIQVRFRWGHSVCGSRAP